MAAKSIKLILLISIILISMFAATAAVRTYTVEETDFLKVHPEAVDLDGDEITYTYSEPLDQEGEWQTDHDDAGTYDVTITASDGQETDSHEINIIVLNKNLPPVITDNKLSIKEAQTIDLKEFISDPDGDALDYEFKHPFDNSGVWETSYQDAGNYLAKFTVNDGKTVIEGRIEITVLDTNQPPEIIDVFSQQDILNVKEGQELEFFAEAEDYDGNSISYRWLLDEEEIANKPSGEHDFGYSSSGEHSLELVVDDGESQTRRSWKISVENTNRKPIVSHVPVIVKEGEKVVLDLPDVDQDGDELEYTFDNPLNAVGEWQTEFDDEGEYQVDIIAEDGKLSHSFEVEITVLDVDLAPYIEFPEVLEIHEGQKKSWTFTASDPDNDQLTIKADKSIEDLNFILDAKTITWAPDFNTIQRKGGFVSNVLNYFRLENYLLKSKEDKIIIKVCGKKECSEHKLNLKVYNVNRAPIIEQQPQLSFLETQEAHFEMKAYDPDGDLVRFHYTNPLGKRSGKWQTDFDDRGVYPVWVTATDGSLGTTENYQLEIEKNNRQPSIKVKKETYTINEGEILSFNVEASDPDSENISLILQDPPKGTSFKEGLFYWETGHDVVKNSSKITKVISDNSYLNRKYNPNKQTIWLSFTAADESFEVIHPVKVIVKNVNQKPEIVDYLPQNEISIKTNEKVLFHITAIDKDEDQLSYLWEFGFNQGRVRGTNTVERTFLTAGKKKIKVMVTDGAEEVEKSWIVNVQEDQPEEIVQKPTHLEPATREPLTIGTYVIETPAKIVEQPEYQQQRQDDYTIGVYYIEN